MLEDKDRQVRFQASKAIPYFIKANKALGTNDVMNKIEEAKSKAFSELKVRHSF